MTVAEAKPQSPPEVRYAQTLARQALNVDSTKFVLTTGVFTAKELRTLTRCTLLHNKYCTVLYFPVLLRTVQYYVQCTSFVRLIYISVSTPRIGEFESFLARDSCANNEAMVYLNLCFLALNSFIKY